MFPGFRSVRGCVSRFASDFRLVDLFLGTHPDGGDEDDDGGGDEDDVFANLTGSNGPNEATLSKLPNAILRP